MIAASHFQMERFPQLNQGSRIYFVGIGGVSMGGLAEIALHHKFAVSGSDPAHSERCVRLESLGVSIAHSHEARHIDDFQPDLVVYTAAIPDDNPELLRAQELQIPCVERAAFLGWLTRRYDHVINVAGTHGKTTTTAMIAEILLLTDVQPTVHLGARFEPFGGSTVRIGKDHNYLVSEACEYKKSLLQFHSTTALLLNIDADHLDVFRDLDEIIDIFVDFALELPSEGSLIVPFEGPHMEEFFSRFEARRESPVTIESFGLMPELYEAKLQGLGRDFTEIDEGTRDELRQAWQAGKIPDYAAGEINHDRGLPSYRFYERGEVREVIHLQIPGNHNILNSLAAIAASRLAGATDAQCARGLELFHGAEGRFSYKGQFQGAPVYADYAHHPTAVRATIDAALAMPHKRLWVVFQPLTYARVKRHFDEFLSALEGATGVIFYEVFTDRERDTLGMSSKLLYQSHQANHERSYFAPDFRSLEQKLGSWVQEGDLVLFLGPEEVRSFAPRLVADAPGQ